MALHRRRHETITTDEALQRIDEADTHAEVTAATTGLVRTLSSAENLPNVEAWRQAKSDISTVTDAGTSRHVDLLNRSVHAIPAKRLGFKPVADGKDGKLEPIKQPFVDTYADKAEFEDDLTSNRKRLMGELKMAVKGHRRTVGTVKTIVGRILPESLGTQSARQDRVLRRAVKGLGVLANLSDDRRVSELTGEQRLIVDEDTSYENQKALNNMRYMDQAARPMSAQDQAIVDQYRATHTPRPSSAPAIKNPTLPSNDPGNPY
jgi:hypothetical protein